MKTRTIKRLFNKIASLRDYERDEFKKSGGVVLLLAGTNEKMTLTPEQLDYKAFQISDRLFESKINRGQKYRMVDYRWAPDVEKKSPDYLDDQCTNAYTINDRQEEKKAENLRDSGY